VMHLYLPVPNPQQTNPPTCYMQPFWKQTAFKRLHHLLSIYSSNPCGATHHVQMTLTLDEVEELYLQNVIHC
jgi:hypothetical protein